MSARSRTARRASASRIRSWSSTASKLALASARKAARSSSHSRSACARARAVTSRPTMTIWVRPPSSSGTPAISSGTRWPSRWRRVELVAGVADALEPQLRAPAGVLALGLLDEVEHRGQRLQLLGRVAGHGQEGRVGVDEAVVLEHEHALADLGERAQQRLVAHGLLAQRALGLAPLGDLEDDAADAQHLAVAAAADGEVGDLELAPHAGRRGGRAGELDVRELAAGREHLAHGRHDALDVGDDLGDRPPDLLGGGDAVDLGEVVVDAHDPQLVVVEREADRCACEHRVEHPVGLVGLLHQGRAVDRRRAALGELGGQLGVRRGQRQRPQPLPAREQGRAGRGLRPERDRAAGRGLDGAQPRVEVAGAGQRLARRGEHARSRRRPLAAGADQRAAGGERAQRCHGEDEQDPVGGLHVVREQARDHRGQQRQRADAGGGAPARAERGEQRRDPVQGDDGHVLRGRQVDHEQQHEHSQRCAHPRP